MAYRVAQPKPARRKVHRPRLKYVGCSLRNKIWRVNPPAWSASFGFSFFHRLLEPLRVRSSRNIIFYRSFKQATSADRRLAYVALKYGVEMQMMERKRDLSPFDSRIAFPEDTKGRFDLRCRPTSKALKMCPIVGLGISCASYPAPFLRVRHNNSRHPKVSELQLD